MKSKLILFVVMFCIFLLNPIFDGVSLAKVAPSAKQTETGTDANADKCELQKIDLKKLGKLSVTHHSITLNGKVLRYKAEAGYMVMKNECDKHMASIFFIAYTKEGESKSSDRPITFSFNGGPGSASLWLHMGALGPKHVIMSDEGFPLPQPFKYADNENSWLEFTDLVFIDPVSTGYSRPAPGVEKKKFHGVQEDISSVGDFIRLYVSKNERWISPKFLVGESYGTTRAAGLSGYLQDSYGLYLQGIVLVSSILNFHTARFAPGNDLPYPLFLPTYTAGAWYHKKLPPDLQKDLNATLKEVEQWALTDYWIALAKGDSITTEEKNQVIDKLARYTGLSKTYIEQNNLRIEIHSFTKELLRDLHLRIGRLDNRFKGNLLDNTYDDYAEDPSNTAIYGAYTAVVNNYLRQDLGYSNDLLYEPITDVRPWNWGEHGYVNVAETLRGAINKNDFLRVMIANGYYDLATPYFATQYTINHMNLPEALRKNIIMKYYEAGHMMYIHKPSRKKLRDDAYEFYTNTLK